MTDSTLTKLIAFWRSEADGHDEPCADSDREFHDNEASSLREHATDLEAALAASPAPTTDAVIHACPGCGDDYQPCPEQQRKVASPVPASWPSWIVNRCWVCGEAKNCLVHQAPRYLGKWVAASDFHEFTPLPAPPGKEQS